MVSLSDFEESRWFEPEESEELSPSTSVVLQSSMVRGWEKVLRRRAVAHIGASRAARSRAVRLLRMAERRTLALSGEPIPAIPFPVEPVTRVLSEDYHSDSGGDSEDEPLSRRVNSHSGFHSSTFTVDSIPAGSDDGQEESEEGSSGSECEEASEVDSESSSDEGEEDDLIYMGREFALSNCRSQELLSRWVLPLAVAVEM